MSIVTSPLHSLYNKLPSISPSSITNGTVSTTSLGSWTKDAFSRNMGKATSAAGTHPYITTALGLGLCVAAYRFLSHLPRPTAQAVNQFARQKTGKINPTEKTSVIKPNTVAKHQDAAQKLEADTGKPREINTISPTIKKRAWSHKTSPAYVCERPENWEKLRQMLATNPKDISCIAVYHYQKSKQARILAYGHYNPEEGNFSHFLSFEIDATALPQQISLAKILQKKHSELGKLVDTTVPEAVEINVYKIEA